MLQMDVHDPGCRSGQPSRSENMAIATGLDDGLQSVQRIIGPGQQIAWSDSLSRLISETTTYDPLELITVPALEIVDRAHSLMHISVVGLVGPYVELHKGQDRHADLIDVGKGQSGPRLVVLVCGPFELLLRLRRQWMCTQSQVKHTNRWLETKRGGVVSEGSWVVPIVLICHTCGAIICYLPDRQSRAVP